MVLDGISWCHLYSVPLLRKDMHGRERDTQNSHKTMMIAWIGPGMAGDVKCDKTRTKFMVYGAERAFRGGMARMGLAPISMSTVRAMVPPIWQWNATSVKPPAGKAVAQQHYPGILGILLTMLPVVPLVEKYVGLDDPRWEDLG